VTACDCLSAGLGPGAWRRKRGTDWHIDRHILGGEEDGPSEDVGCGIVPWGMEAERAVELLGAARRGGVGIGRGRERTLWHGMARH
jgi:hypothetical protein